jgi:hypothetical protein
MLAKRGNCQAQHNSQQVNESTTSNIISIIKKEHSVSTEKITLTQLARSAG